MAKGQAKRTAREVVAANLRRLRLARELSQDELAHRAGVHRTYVGAVERGEKNISIDNIEKFAKALRCSIVEMVEDVE